MLIDQARARILGDSFAIYARQEEFTRGTPNRECLSGALLNSWGTTFATICRETPSHPKKLLMT